MLRLITTVILGFVSLSALTLTGCHVQGEIGDTAYIAAPR
jgi:hypothetical protein